MADGVETIGEIPGAAVAAAAVAVLAVLMS